MLITLSEAYNGNHFYIKHIEATGKDKQRLYRLGIDTNITLVLLHKINAGRMIAVQIGEKSVALQKEETDQIYGEVLV
ncbi:FeoA family protein [Pontibacillus marinus]|uniref:Ferrous iron transporter FeoA-like domain-containing protein n=1 Tax=Pontibacillus marinus BH030004 = DSM 16465 TaxID=1385511 RepID=A0A0A5G9S7_9BACI|nr:FeoA family protein [Pontibacillus marinus]KGX87870.1 hypothetical protein N783_09200 [Pontibacillus marinus BH030004 = DSM 16465]